MRKKKVKMTKEQLEKENKLLRKHHLKLTIEIEYLKKLDVLVYKKKTK